MARLSTGQTYGDTNRRTSPRLLGGADSGAFAGGELGQRQLASPALQPQAQPVNTFIQTSAPTLGGPVRMFAPPELPAPNKDMANLATALSSFNPALREVGELYQGIQTRREEEAKQRGAMAAAKVARFGGFADYGEAVREVEKRATQDPALNPLLTELRALDPRALKYAQIEVQDALVKQRMGSIKEDLANLTVLPDGRRLETVNQNDPAFFDLVSSQLLPANISPTVLQRNQANMYALIGSLRSDQTKRHADFKDEQTRQGFVAGLSGDITLLYSGMIDATQLRDRLGQRLTDLYANSRPSLYKEQKDKLLDNLAEAAVAAAGGDLKAMDRMGPALAEALETVPAGPNGEPLIDQFGRPRQSVINDFYRKLTTGLSTDRDLQDKMDQARGQDAADGDIQQYLPQEVLNDPAQLQARLDALPKRAAQLFPNDPEAQLAYMNRVQAAATNYSRAYLAPIQRDTAAQEYSNQALNPSSDPTADIQRYTQMFKNRQIDEADYKSLVAGARARAEKKNDRNYETLRGLQRDLQQQLTEQFKLTTEGDGTPAVTPSEAARIRKTMGDFYRMGEDVIIKNPGANLDQQLGEMFQRVTMPAIQQGQQQSKQPQYKSPADVSKVLGPGRGNAETVAKIRRQVDIKPLYSPEAMGAQLDSILSGKPLDGDTKKVLKQLQMKPSEFFIKQMQLHGIPLDSNIQQRLRKLDGSDLVSSAQPMGGTGGLAMIQPGRTASMAQRMWRQWQTAMASVLPPAAAAERGTSPFTGSSNLLGVIRDLRGANQFRGVSLVKNKRPGDYQSDPSENWFFDFKPNIVPKAVARAQRLSEQDVNALAFTALTEAGPTPRGKLEVAANLINRSAIAGNKPIVDIAKAPGQYEGVFGYSRAQVVSAAEGRRIFGRRYDQVRKLILQGL